MYKRTPVDKPIEHLINSYTLLIMEKTLGLKTTNHCNGNTILWRLSVCMYVCLFVPLCMSFSLNPPPLLSVCLSVCLSVFPYRFPAQKSCKDNLSRYNVNYWPEVETDEENEATQTTESTTSVYSCTLSLTAQYHSMYLTYTPTLPHVTHQYVFNLYTHPPSRYSPVCI